MKKINILCSILLPLIVYLSPSAIASEIADVEASRIVVKHISKLTDAGMSPKFSPSGNLLAYTTACESDKCSSVIVIMNTQTRKIIKTFAVDGGLPGVNVVWHPNENRFAYCSMYYPIKLYFPQFSGHTERLGYNITL